MAKPLFGLNIDPRADRTAMAFQLASLADEHGLDIVSVMDHPEQPRFLETWTLLVALAMRTERVAVLPNVASVPLRPPAMLAKAASTLAILTGGRVIPSRAAGPTSIAMIPGAAVAVRSDPNIDRPGALRVDLSTGAVAAARRRPAGRT